MAELEMCETPMVSSDNYTKLYRDMCESMFI